MAGATIFERNFENLKIITACIGAAIVYGVIHDEITAHLCVEYFTVAHPRIFPTLSPTLLGIAWGVTGTWWLGLLLGLLLAKVGQSDSNSPKLSAFQLLPRILVVCVATAISAVIAGLVTYDFAAASHIVLPDPHVPADKHVIFFSVWAAHLASYIVAITCSLAVVLNVWSVRIRRISD